MTIKWHLTKLSVCILAGALAFGMGVDHSLKAAQAQSPLHVHAEISLHSGTTGVAWSPDGKTLATYSNYGQQIDIWRDDGTRVATLHRTGFGPYTRSSIAFLADNHSLLTPPDRTTPHSETAALSIWDVRSGAVIGNVTGPVPNAVGYAPNRASEFSVSADKTTVAIMTSIADTNVAVYSVQDWSILYRLRTRDIGLGIATSLALSADGRILAIGTGDGRVAIFSRRSAMPTLVIAAYDPRRLVLINSLAFSPDGMEIAVGAEAALKDEHEPTVLQVFSVSNGRLTKSPSTGELQLIRSLAWQKQGGYVALAAQDDQLRLWDISNDSVLTKALTPIAAVSFSPSGDLLAVCNGDHVTILDIPVALSRSERAHE